MGINNINVNKPLKREDLDEAMHLNPKDYLLILIPIVVILLFILSAIFVTPEDYDPSYDNRIPNCGPGGTSC